LLRRRIDRAIGAAERGTTRRKRSHRFLGRDNATSQEDKKKPASAGHSGFFFFMADNAASGVSDRVPAIEEEMTTGGGKNLRGINA